jgi:hypothetical protein
MTGAELAEAFNTACPRKNWRARAVAKGGNEIVHFEDRTGLVHLSYVVARGEFLVVFKQAVASFGDYANAICKALVTVLSGLQAGGAPFPAPPSLADAEIVIKHGGIGGQISVRWAGGENVVRDEPDTSDIPEADEEFFERARLVMPDQEIMDDDLI